MELFNQNTLPMLPAKIISRATAIAACLLLSLGSFSQSATLEYYEVSAEPNEGATSAGITCVLAIRDVESLDSLFLDIRDGGGATVYSAGNTAAGWTAAHPSRTQGGILYLTVEAGSFSLPERYEATATLRSGSEVLAYTKP